MAVRPFILGNSIYITTLAFMNFFKDLEVRNYGSRYDKDSLTRRMPVQISMDSKERIYYQIKHGGFKSLEQQDIQLPRLSVDITSIDLRTEDYTGKEQSRILFKNESELSRDIQPVPISINYTLGLWTLKYEHYLQLIEQILPCFDPYATAGVKERNYNLEREIKFDLTGHTQGHTFKVSGNEKRIIRGEIAFTASTVIYKFLKEGTSDLINKAFVYTVDIKTPISSEVVVLSGDGDYVL